MADLVATARAFAIKAHASIDQRRRYTGEPYIVHPAKVVRIVSGTPHTKAMLAAAWLHDVVEDTPVTMEDLAAVFPKQVVELVDWLTEHTTPADGNRATRKRIECDRIGRAPAAAQTIKLADLIDNTSSIVAHDPEFAVTYLAELASLLDAMTRGDRTLHQWALMQLREARR